MIEPLRLQVLTPTERLLDIEGVAWVQVQLADGGPIGIHPGHAPLLAETVAAPLRYADESGEQTIALEAGILQVDRSGVLILTSGPTQAPERTQAAEGPRFDRLAHALLGKACLRDGGNGQDSDEEWPT